MYIGRFLIAILMITLSACKDEMPPPKLDIVGHWIVDHGFFDNECQVTSTFTEKQMLLSFHSKVEGACVPEMFGLTSNVLALDIVSREDFLSDTGALSASLKVAAPDYDVNGSLTLTEAKGGLSGVIVEATDPGGYLQLLLNKTYPLTRVPENWFSIAKGSWGIWEDDVRDGITSTELIKLFEIDSLTSARVFVDGAAVPASISPEGAAAIRDGILNVTFSVKNHEKIKDGTYKLDVMIIFDEANVEPVNGIFEFNESKEGVTLIITAPGEENATSELVKIENQ